MRLISNFIIIGLGIHEGCNTICGNTEEHICENEGFCSNIFNINGPDFKCTCDKTSYIGKHCNEGKIQFIHIF